MPVSKEAQLNIVYDDSLQNERVPYRVVIDSKRASLLFLTHGMPEEQLQDTTLKLTTKLFLEDGFYDPPTRTMTISCDGHWEKYDYANREEINTTFLHESRHALDHDEVVKWRLNRPLRSRIVPNTPYLLPVITVGVVGIFIEDQSNSTYLIDYLAGGLYALAGSSFAAWGGSILLNYWVNPLERRARAFAKTLNQDPQWRNIITIKPKNIPKLV